jgi:hypothetical protein
MEDKQFQPHQWATKLRRQRELHRLSIQKQNVPFDWSVQQMIPVVNFHLSWDCSSEREAIVAAQPFGKLLQHAMKTTLVHRLVIQTELWIFTHIMGMTCMLSHPERAQPLLTQNFSLSSLQRSPVQNHPSPGHHLLERPEVCTKAVRDIGIIVCTLCSENSLQHTCFTNEHCFHTKRKWGSHLTTLHIKTYLSLRQVILQEGVKISPIFLFWVLHNAVACLVQLSSHKPFIHPTFCRSSTTQTAQQTIAIGTWQPNPQILDHQQQLSNKDRSITNKSR